MQTLSASTLATPYLVQAEELHDQTSDALKNHGCLACITKPFQPETLLRTVHNALSLLIQQDVHQPGRKPEKTAPRVP